MPTPSEAPRTTVAALARRLLMPTANLISGFCLLFGILGLLFTGFDFFSNVTGVTLVGLSVNPLVNVIHLVVGLVGIPLSASPRGARAFLLAVGGLGLPFAVAGFLLDGSMSDFFATNTAMNVLHLSIAVASLAVGLLVRGPLSGRWQPRPLEHYLPKLLMAVEVAPPPAEPPVAGGR